MLHVRSHRFQDVPNNRKYAPPLATTTNALSGQDPMMIETVMRKDVGEELSQDESQER